MQLISKLFHCLFRFCDLYRNHPEQWWEGVCFLDEVTYRIATRSGTRHLVRRPAGSINKFKAQFVRPKVRISEAINCWAAFPGPLVFLAKKQTMKKEKFLEILDEWCLPFMELNNLHTVLMDKAPYHQAIIVQEFLDANNIARVAWAGNSPDLNRFCFVLWMSSFKTFILALRTHLD